MRWLTGQDSDMQTVVAGFLAGASMIFYKSSTIALYAACKVAEVRRLTLYYEYLLFVYN